MFGDPPSSLYSSNNGPKQATSRRYGTIQPYRASIPMPNGRRSRPCEPCSMGFVPPTQCDSLENIMKSVSVRPPLASSRARGRYRGRYRRWLSASALVLGGCASTCGASSNPGTIGELGNGRFHYACGGPNDPVCEFEVDQQFPDCIALGGSFSLEYMVLDTSIFDPTDINPILYIESVNQDYFRGEESFQAVRVGEAAFIVRESNNVLDLLHLDIVEPDRIEVIGPQAGEPLDAFTLEAGDSESLRVFPRTSACPTIGGEVPFTAQSSDETVVTVGTAESLRLTAVSEGSAVVRVTLGDIEHAITIEVTGSTSPPNTDSGSDAGDSTSSTGDTTESDASGTDTQGGSSDSGSDSGGSSSGSTTGGSKGGMQ